MLTSRERILKAINHKETDRIPVDFGGTSITGIHVMAYSRLLKYMGFDDLEVRLFDPMMQLAVVDNRLRDLFFVDTVKLYRPTPKFGIAIHKGYKDGQMPNGESMKVPIDFNPIKDDRGFILKSNNHVIARRGKSSIYYDGVFHPLENKGEVEDLKDFKPKPYNQQELDFIKKTVSKLRKDSERAIIFSIKGSFLETPWDLRGIDNFLMDLVLNRKYTEILLDKLLDYYIIVFDQIKSVVGDQIDIVKITDDFGNNNNLLISPSVYREMIKPRQRKLFNHIKSNSNYKIFLHSCGSISKIIGDLIEIGIDIINPLQPNAKHMEPEFLKRNFGKDLTFWGGTISPGELVRFNIKEIREYIKRRVNIFAEGGGFVYAYSHNFQPDIPPEKIKVFFDIVCDL